MTAQRTIADLAEHLRHERELTRHTAGMPKPALRQSDHHLFGGVK